MHKPLKFFAAFVALLAFLLVIAGGLVTSTASALAMRGWPFSFAQVFPRVPGGAFYAQAHQFLASATGVLTIVLAIWLTSSKAIAPVKRAAWVAVGIVILQAVLGMIAVFLRLPTVMSVAHGCLGQIYFSWMACLAVFTAIPEALARRSPPADRDARLIRLSAMTTGFIFLQLLAGAIYRHTGNALHLHFLGALLVLIHIVLTCRRVYTGHSDDGLLVYPATAMLSLLGFQLVLGWFAWREPSIAATTTHLANGALILASSLLVTIQLACRPAVV